MVTESAASSVLYWYFIMEDEILRCHGKQLRPACSRVGVLQRGPERPLHEAIKVEPRLQ